MRSAEHLIVVRLTYIPLGIAPCFDKKACVEAVNDNEHCARINDLGDFVNVTAKIHLHIGDHALSKGFR